jgi:hypothetical protein
MPTSMFHDGCCCIGVKGTIHSLSLRINLSIHPQIRLCCCPQKAAPFFAIFNLDQTFIASTKIPKMAIESRLDALPESVPIEINVGGKLFTISLATLMGIPNPVTPPAMRFASLFDIFRPSPLSLSSDLFLCRFCSGEL